MKAGIRRNTPDEEAEIQRAISADPDNPEWTDDDFAAARPAKDVIPAKLYAELISPRQRGSGRKPAKAQVTLRLDRDVIDGLRATGPGWQSRINEALRRLINL